MAIAPDPQLRACLRVVYMASIDARMAGWSGDVNAERLADLMDAIHNIPHLIQNWDQCNEDLLKSNLLDYERKWFDAGPCLRTIYEHELSKRIE